MDVLEAIKSRKSIRAFTNRPASKKTIQKILEISQRAPSGTNTQPWHVYVCAGAVRQAITDDVMALAAESKAAKYEDYDYLPTSLERHTPRTASRCRLKALRPFGHKKGRSRGQCPARSQKLQIF